MSVGEQIMGRFVTSLKLPGTGAWSHCPVHGSLRNLPIRYWYWYWYWWGFKTSTRNLKFINYANLFKINEKCYFSSISQRILILFILSDRDWWGLRNLNTLNLKFINYANLCKFIQNQWKMLFLLYFAADFDSVFYLIGLGGGFETSTQNFEISFCKFIQNLRKMLYFSVSQRNLILFVLSDRAWWGLKTWWGLWNWYTQNFEIN